MTNAKYLSKVCGDKTENNALYAFLCAIHGKDLRGGAYLDSKTAGESASASITVVASRASQCSCKTTVKMLCDLPDFDQTPCVNVAYFDCLYYALVAKIRALYLDFMEALRLGRITPDQNLAYKSSQYASIEYTASHILQELLKFWTILIDARLIATLDTAVRLRNMGDWSVILDEPARASFTRQNCSERRKVLLAYRNGNIQKNMAFLRVPGLIDVSQEDIDMIYETAKDVHQDAMEDKDAFYEGIKDRIRDVHHEELQLEQTKRESHAAAKGKGLAIGTKCSCATGCECSQICTSPTKKNSRCPCDCTKYISGAPHPQVTLPIYHRGHDLQPTPLPLPTLQASNQPIAVRRNAARQLYHLELQTGVSQSQGYPACEPLSLSQPAASQGPQSPPHMTSPIDPTLPPPINEGTWSATKEELFALLPETPTYKVEKEAPRSGSSRKGSIGFLGSNRKERAGSGGSLNLKEKLSFFKRDKKE